MKPKNILALFASLALAAPALAQTITVQGALQNGDLETGVAAPFEGDAGTISTGTINDHTTGTTAGHCIEVDLTAPNGNQQWKSLTDNPGGPVPTEFDLAYFSCWVYVPSATTFGSGTARVNANGQQSADGITGWSNTAGGSTQLNLKTMARDTWVQVAKTQASLAAGTGHIRMNMSLQTETQIDDGLGGMVNTFDNGTDPVATPAQWIAAGYSGVIYLDDFEAGTTAPPDPSILLCEDVRNADLETGTLSPWSVESGAGSIGTSPGDPVHTGTYSLGFDVAVNGDGNRWKQFNNVATAPASPGDRINGQVWIYIPSGTVVDPSRGRFSFQTRSDNGDAGQGRIGQTFIDIRPGNHPRDVWTPHTWQHLAVDGANSITSVNTGGYFLETQNQADTDSNSYTYSGLVYLDDFKVVNIGPATPGVIVDDSTFNGDLEDPTISPWLVSGAGSLSTTLNHTTGGSQSLCVDLTVNNSNQQWKDMAGPTMETPIENFTKADISAWVYVPAATTFGGTAIVNLPIRDGGAAQVGGPSIDLTSVTRDTWVEVSAVDIDVSSFTTSLAVSNWNVETEILVGGTGSLVRADGSDGTAATGDDSGADLVGPAVPQDWIDAGYNGVFYIDDFYAALHSPGAPGAPIQVNSITYDGTDVVLNYNTSFDAGGFSGVDIYYSTDLVNWTADVFVTASGNNLEVTRPSGDAARYYILVEPGKTPNFGNFPAPPNVEG